LIAVQAAAADGLVRDLRSSGVAAAAVVGEVVAEQAFGVDLD
jgi:hypothetical protein